MEVYYSYMARGAGEASEWNRDLRALFCQSTGSIGPTANTQLSAPIQENMAAIRKGQ
jgi:hypothetical protein